MSRWQTALRNAPLLMRGVYEYNWAARRGTLPLREWMFPVTYRCNARCIMCDIWQADKGGELSAQQWAPILQDPLFRSVESVNLTGGEPTLRQDFAELVQVLGQELPALRRITITTNALDPPRVSAAVRAAAAVCASRGASFFVGISLDGIGAVHDRMRNIPDAFDRVQETIAALRGVRLGVNCTLTSQNLNDAANVERWCAEHSLPANFIVASFSDSYYGNTAARDTLAIGPDQQPELLALLRRWGDRRSVGNLGAYFYADLARMIGQRASRTTPCIFQKSGAIIDARGDMQYCMFSRQLGNVSQQPASELYYASHNLAHRQDLVTHRCATCTITCFLELGLAKDAGRYLHYLLEGHA
jgi:MoaA/NifB/PqqE/SkfB family radical SAM enzyme